MKLLGILMLIYKTKAFYYQYFRNSSQVTQFLLHFWGIHIKITCESNTAWKCATLPHWTISWKLWRNFYFLLGHLHELGIFLKFYFIFKLYNIVLVLPNIEMNLSQVYMCSPSWTLLPPPSPYHPSGSSQCTSPTHPVLCIEPGLATRFIHDIIHVSMSFFISISYVSIHSPTSHSIARSLILVSIYGDILAAFKFGLSRGNENFQSLWKKKNN